jgi:hypothetical protein
MKKMNLFLLFCLGFICCSDLGLENEKQILLKMKQNIDKQIDLVDKLNSNNSNLDNTIISPTHGESISIISPKIKNSNKTIQLVNYYDSNTIGLNDGEKIIGIHALGYRYHYDKTTKYKKLPITLLVTNKLFYVIKDKKVVTTTEILSNNVEILKVDFSQFNLDDDSSIVIYTNNSEISILTVSLSIKVVDPANEVILLLTIVNICRC